MADYNYYGSNVARSYGIRPDTMSYQEQVARRPDYELVGYCNSYRCAKNSFSKTGVEVMRIKRSSSRRLAPTVCPVCGWPLHWKSKKVEESEETDAKGL